MVTWLPCSIDDLYVGDLAWVHVTVSQAWSAQPHFKVPCKVLGINREKKLAEISLVSSDDNTCWVHCAGLYRQRY